MSITPRAQVYRNVIVTATTTILSGQTQSSQYNCTISPDVSGINHGSSALRVIIFPLGWTTCDVTFKGYNPLLSNSINDIYISDGQDIGVYTITNATAETQINLIPYCFDTITNLIISCSVAQVDDAEIGLLLQPIYQGIA